MASVQEVELAESNKMKEALLRASVCVCVSVRPSFVYFCCHMVTWIWPYCSVNVCVAVLRAFVCLGLSHLCVILCNSDIYVSMCHSVYIYMSVNGYVCMFGTKCTNLWKLLSGLGSIFYYLPLFS